MAIYYEIRVQGHLDSRWARRFQGLEMALLPGGETVLSGPLADQAALHSILARIRDLGLPLLLVTRLTPGSNSTGDKAAVKEGN